MIHKLFYFSLLDSSDGSLKASTHHGAIDVYVSQLRKVDLKSQKGQQTKTNMFLVAAYDVKEKRVRGIFIRLENMNVFAYLHLVLPHCQNMCIHTYKLVNSVKGDETSNRLQNFCIFQYFFFWHSTCQHSAELTCITTFLCRAHSLLHGADICMCRVTTITCLHFFFLFLVKCHIVEIGKQETKIRGPYPTIPPFFLS